MDVFPTVLNGFYGQLGALIVTLLYLAALWPVRRLQAALRAPAIKVYLSSTLLDLSHHREAVAAGVRKAGCRLLGDPPDEHAPRLTMEQRRAAIAAADLFIGLYAWQYGPVPGDGNRNGNGGGNLGGGNPGGGNPGGGDRGNPTGRSWTEEEYELAQARPRLPQHRWVVREHAAWPKSLMDEDTRAGSSPIGMLRAKVEPGAEALPERPSALADQVYRVVTARQRELHPNARLRAELVSYRAFALSGLVAVVSAVYAAYRFPGGSADHLLAVLGVATVSAVACYLARVAATQLIWKD